MSDYVSIYTTFTDKVEAERVIDVLLDKQLIACANLSAPMTSYYRWEGKREEAVELAAIMKTQASHQAEVIKIITEMHSYDCPCVVVWPITEGNAGYLEWIKHETPLP